MLGFGSKSLLVIDPGRHTLKVGVGTLGVRGRSAKLQTIHTVPTGATLQMTPDQIIDKQGELLRDMVKTLGLKGKHVSFSIPGRASFVRQLKIPKVSGDRLKRLIQYEARQQIPFPLEDIILDSHVFDSDGPELGVTLVAVRRTIIDQYCASLKLAGLVPDVLDVSTLSLFDAYYPQLKTIQKESEGDAPGQETVIALVDIGASTTDIIVCKSGKVEFIRTAPQAGDQLTKVIADQMGKGWEEAEHLKVSLGELDPTIDRRTDPLAYGEGETKARVKVFVSKAFEGITNEIKRTLDFYVSQPEGEPIGRILLTGGTACCPGIAHFIEERLGIPCEVKNPLEGSLVAFNPQVSSNEGFATNSAIIIGQCQRNIANVPLRMTFLPPPIVHLKDFQRRRPLLVLEGIGLAAFIGFSVVTMGKTIEVYNQATDRLMVNIDGPDDNARQIREFITSTSKIEERVEYLREIGLSRGVVSQTMAEIAEKIPLGKTWVDSVDIDTTEIKLHMRGNNEQSVNPFKDQMKDVARLREMTVPEVKVLGSEGIEFLMSAKVEKNPSIELTKLREKLEVRDILALDVSLEDHSENPGAKQRAAIRVVVIEPFSEAERDELVLKILRAEDEAQLGFESKSIAIVFNDKKRKDRGQYDISHEELQSLIQGKSGVKDLTLKEPEVTAEETPAMTGMEGMTGEAGVGMEGMGMGMGMGMGGMGMGGMVPPDGASTGTEAAPAD